jgi:hypothetical protein
VSNWGSAGCECRYDQLWKRSVFLFEFDDVPQNPDGLFAWAFSFHPMKYALPSLPRLSAGTLGAPRRHIRPTGMERCCRTMTEAGPRRAAFQRQPSASIIRCRLRHKKPEIPLRPASVRMAALLLLHRHSTFASPLGTSSGTVDARR